MPNWWGNMTGAQAVQMGMNIFELSQQQAQQQQELQRQQEQQAQENFFRKMQLDLQAQRLGLEKERQEAALEFDDKRMQREQMEFEREQEKQGKLAEYSQGLSEMIDTLDFSSPEDMKKLYAFQTKYQPWGVKPSYIKPEKVELPEEAKPMSQKDYGNLVFKTWNELKDYAEKKYKDDLERYENLGFWERRKKDEQGRTPTRPELFLPTLDQARELTNEMLKRGDTIKDVLKPQPEPQVKPQVMPQPALRPQVRTPLGPTAPPFAIPPAPQNPYSGFLGMFSKSKRRYNALSPGDRKKVDNLVGGGYELSEALDYLDEYKTMKRQ
jgi:hypothetical protein